LFQASSGEVSMLVAIREEEEKGKEGN